MREKEAEFKPRVEESLGLFALVQLAQVGEDSEGHGRGGRRFLAAVVCEEKEEKQNGGALGP